MKATPDFIDYTILSISSEDTDYPGSNLKVYESSTQSFRTQNTSLLTIDIDLGAGVQDPTVLIYNPNFKDQILFRGNTSNNWGAPPFSSSNFNIEYDPEHFIYKRGIEVTGFNYRYMRIEIPVQSRVDSAAYYEIGVIAIFGTKEVFSKPGENFNLPLEGTNELAEELDEFSGNRKQIISYSDVPVLNFNLVGNFKYDIATRTKVMNVFGHPQKSLVYMETNDENSFEVYLMQRVLSSIGGSKRVAGNKGVKRYSFTYETIL